MKEIYTAHVSVTGGRDGAATSSDGRLELKLGFPQELGGSGNAPNAEQLFVAGYAACFASSLKAAAKAQGVDPGHVRVAGQGTLALRGDGSYAIASVRLVVHAPGIGATADAVVAEARRICAYSNATRGNVHTDVALA